MWGGRRDGRRRRRPGARVDVAWSRGWCVQEVDDFVEIDARVGEGEKLGGRVTRVVGSADE